MHDDTILWKLLDGELPPSEAAAIEADGARDSALRRRLDDLRTIKESILAGAPRPPAGFAARVAARAAARPPTPVIDLEEARRFLRRALVAAAVLAALGITYVALRVVPAIFEPPDILAGPELWEEPK